MTEHHTADAMDREARLYHCNRCNDWGYVHASRLTREERDAAVWADETWAVCPDCIEDEERSLRTTP